MTAASVQIGGRTRLLWLDLTRRCQLECGHCYNDSGPKGTHGSMEREDWLGVLADRRPARRRIRRTVGVAVPGLD